MKKIKAILDKSPMHWVGNGFPVSSMFSYHQHADDINPFLLLDHAGPKYFSPSETEQRGVGEHPHRGFETVTIVYEGEVEHRDSSGAGGKIGPGDVQWMTAASGLVHEEFHSKDFVRKGGTLEMIQLWVNLPAKFKMSPPRYQEIVSKDIPVVALDEKGSSAKIIAGEYENVKGAAKTFSPINLWSLSLKKETKLELELPEGHTTLFFLFKGKVTMNSSDTIKDEKIIIFERDGKSVALEVDEDSSLLVLMGEPIDEPIVGHGPFVMNTQDEIRQAISDFQKGLMGSL